MYFHCFASLDALGRIYTSRGEDRNAGLWHARTGKIETGLPMRSGQQRAQRHSALSRQSTQFIHASRRTFRNLESKRRSPYSGLCPGTRFGDGP